MIPFLVCLALLQDPGVYVEKATGLRFDKKVGALSRGKIDDYAKEGRPELGVSIQYYHLDEEGRMDMSINAYVYNLGEKKIPDGVESKTVKKHFEQVKRDVTSMKGPEGWSSVKHIADGRANLGAHPGAPVALRAEFKTTMEGGEGLGSLIYLRGHKDHFIKVRVTYRLEAKKACEKEFGSLLANLGRQIKPPPESKKPKK